MANSSDKKEAKRETYDTMKTKATKFERMMNDRIFEERKKELKRHKIVSDKLDYGPQKWRMFKWKPKDLTNDQINSKLPL